MQSRLEQASDSTSRIEMGAGIYLEARYVFADDVLATVVPSAWGQSAPEWKSVMERVVELTLALMVLRS